MRKYKCKYCSKKYKGWNYWFFRHFKIYHPEDKIHCIAIEVK